MKYGHSQFYTCPMHPEVRRDTPGICPECGMNLVPAKEKQTKSDARETHDKHAGHSTEMFLKKFWISLILTVPVVLYADVVQKVLGWSPPDFPGSAYLPLILGSIVFFYGGWVFLVGAARELRARLPGMMTLIGIAVLTAYFYSVIVVFTGGGEALFWELTTLITIMLLGHWVEMRAVSNAQGALRELTKLLPDTAEVIRGGGSETIPLSELKVENTVLVRPGAKVPADGEIIEGRSELNEAMVTGESRPINKGVGEKVIAGTINGDGALKIAVKQIGEHTFLAGVMRLIAEAQASKSRLQILSDRAAMYLTAIAVGGGVVTFLAWFLVKAGFGFATTRLVAVLVIACPHALGLAVPLVAAISTTKAARHGLLVKQRLALESARNIDVVLFDKTGTLTEGVFGVTGYSSDEALALAAAVDSRSEHPVARGIFAKAKEMGLPVKEAENFKRLPGVGAEADVKEHRVFVGHRGGDDIVVELDGENIGSIQVADKIRPVSPEAVRMLREAGVKVAMITGDSEEVAHQVAGELGLDEYFARVLPQEKVERVKELQAKGLRVAMVGDGVNDAPALTQADLGIAIGAGTNVAIESAGIILVRNDPRDILKIIKLSRLTYAKMIQNLFWATGYNVAALPLAAGALAFKGIVLQPALAALLMSVSTVIVAFNALLLRQKKLD